LVQHRDAEPTCPQRVLDRNRIALKRNSASVWTDVTGKDADQRGLSCAIGTEKRMNLTCVRLEAHRLKRSDGAEGLRHAGDFEQRRGTGRQERPLATSASKVGCGEGIAQRD
jgi:hypothetical protein